MRRALLIAVAGTFLWLSPTGVAAQTQTFYVSDNFNAPGTGSYSGTYTVDAGNNIVGASISVTAGVANNGSPVVAQTYGFGGYDVGNSFSVINANFYGGLLTSTPSKSSPTSVDFFEGVCGSPQCDTTQNNERTATGGLVALVVVPTVTSLSPASGQVDGGQAITINGSGFFGATSLTFGGVAATSFTVLNGTTITAVTPPLSLGVKEIVVTAPGGANSVAPTTNDFTVTPTPVPTLSEWAMILFGLILAGGAAVMIQRRQMAV